MQPHRSADEFSPINLDRDRNSVVEDVKDRLDSLLRKYGCDPTPEGWRELALQLAIKHEKATKVHRKFTKQYPNFGEILLMARSLRKSPGLSQAEAANRIAKATGKNAKSLEARFSEAMSSEKAVFFKPHSLMEAFEEAATKLENEPRKSTSLKKLLADQGRPARAPPPG